MAKELVDQIGARPFLQPRQALTLIGGGRNINLKDYECLAGVSVNVSSLKDFISVQAARQTPVLLTGENGLRQEQVARLIHQAGPNWAQPFFAVNTHTLDNDSLDSLMFGPRGMMENSERGTIYINDLTGLPVLLQQRFATFIEEQRWRISSGRSQPNTAPRLIFSTKCDASELKADNRIAYSMIEFLRPMSFEIKPLRNRSEDIPYLATHLAERIASRLNKGLHVISPPAMKMLSDYIWEGNIDELEATLESIIASTSPHQIDEARLPARIRYFTFKSIPSSGIDLPDMVDDFERSLIETALRQTNGNQTKASILLGLRVQTLNMKLKRFTELGKEIKV
jgi:DNA-binding NtrC family response regulator